MRTLLRASAVRDADRTLGDWILLDGERIAAIGSGDPPPADGTIGLPGAVIRPGFIDAHVHLDAIAVDAGMPDVRAARSASDLLRAIGSAATAGRGPLLVYGFDETTWGDPTLPSPGDIGAVAAGRPAVVVRVDGHVAMADDATLAMAGVDASRPEVLRRPDGQRDGRVVGGAARDLQRWAHAGLSGDDVADLQRRGAAIAAQHGVTTVHEMTMIAERGRLDLDVLLHHRDELPITVHPYVATTDVALATQLGLPAIGGDLPFDGSIGARTACLHHPYADGTGSGATSVAEDDLRAFFDAGDRAGLQVGVHAIGDAAIDAVVDAWRWVAARRDAEGVRRLAARRHRIEHFEMPSPSAIRGAAELGLVASVQSTFDATWGGPGGLYERALGIDRAGQMNPFRTLRSSGVRVAAGTDAPITSIDPLASLVAFGRHHRSDERLTRTEALEAMTRGAAGAAHEEHLAGSLAVGARADLVAYDRDPVLEDDPRGMLPVLVLSRGRVVHRG